MMTRLSPQQKRVLELMTTNGGTATARHLSANPRTIKALLERGLIVAVPMSRRVDGAGYTVEMVYRLHSE